MTVANLIAVLLVSSLASFAQPALPQPTQGDFVIRDFRFTSGETLPELKIHYRTFGKPEKDARGTVTGWTATAFLPWTGWKALPSTRGVPLPPRAGDAWRFNLFRIDRPGGKAAPETGAVEVAWSQPPGDSFHVPDVFRDLVFEGPR